MRAISLHQPWATLIAQGKKTIESRTWATKHRGKLLICSSKSPWIKGHLCGYALCVVNVVDCRPFLRVDLKAACMKIMSYPLYAWVLKDITPIEPFPVRGRQGFFEVDDKLIKPPQTPHFQQKLRL